MNERAIFLKTCAGEPVPRPPVWLMRQVGRYMDKYQALRKRCSFLELISHPAIAAEATLIALEDLDPDALIVFSDILPVIASLGAEIRYQPSLTVNAGLDKLKAKPDTSWLTPAYETLRLVKKETGDRKALIGFAGAPFTLFYYLMNKSEKLRSFLLLEEKKARSILERIAYTAAQHLRSQVEAGADVLQVFDSHACDLSPALYRRFAREPLQLLLHELDDLNVPVIIFARGRHHVDNREYFKNNILSIDWTVPFCSVGDPQEYCVQGNLDPAVLLGGPELTRRETEKMLTEIKNNAFGGYIANLGHGVLPNTPLESAREFIQTVKDFSRDST